MANASILAAFERMWQHMVSALDDKSNIDHTHDDVYYTEAEIDERIGDINTSVSGKADKEHTHVIADVTDLQTTLDTLQEGIDEHTHSWDELEDKPFYSNDTILAQVENESVSLTTEDRSYYMSGFFGKTEVSADVTSVIGANVDAVIDGVEVSGVLQEVTYMSSYFEEETTCVFAGNPHLLDNKSSDLADTGENWCITVDLGEAYPYDNAVNFALYGTADTDHVVSVTCYIANTKTLDPKYLPDSVATKDDIPEVPTNVSAFTNDAGYLTELPEECVTEDELNTLIVAITNDEIDAICNASIASAEGVEF